MNIRSATPTEELRKLIIENPDLELVPMVAEECSSEYSHTMCELSSCRIDEWTLNPYDDEQIFYKSDDYSNFEDLFFDNCEAEEINEEMAKAAWEALPWTRAIIVYVDTM